MRLDVDGFRAYFRLHLSRAASLSLSLSLSVSLVIFSRRCSIADRSHFNTSSSLSSMSNDPEFFVPPGQSITEPWERDAIVIGGMVQATVSDWQFASLPRWREEGREGGREGGWKEASKQAKLYSTSHQVHHKHRNHQVYRSDGDRSNVE